MYPGAQIFRTSLENPTGIVLWDFFYIFVISL